MPLSCSVFDDVTIVPFQQKDSETSYACYDCHGNPIYEGMQLRYETLSFALAPLETVETVETLAYHSAIFGGVFFHHFGHFLLETLGRLWFAKKHPHIPIIFIAHNAYILDFEKEILSLLEITNKIYFVDRQIKVNQLFIPEAGYCIPNTFDESHRCFLSVYKPGETISGKKIYLSRRHFGGESSITNEDELEKLVMEYGYTVVYPEEHSVSEQLELLGSAETVLAIEGSALHSLILLESVSAHVLIIPRPGQSASLNYTTIAIKKNIKQTYIPIKNLYSSVKPTESGSVYFRATLNLDLFRRYLELPSWNRAHMIVLSQSYSKKEEMDPKILTLNAYRKIKKENSILKKELNIYKKIIDQKK